MCSLQIQHTESAISTPSPDMELVYSSSKGIFLKHLTVDVSLYSWQTPGIWSWQVSAFHLFLTLFPISHWWIHYPPHMPPQLSVYSSLKYVYVYVYELLHTPYQGEIARRVLKTINRVPCSSHDRFTWQLNCVASTVAYLQDTQAYESPGQCSHFVYDTYCWHLFSRVHGCFLPRRQ